MVLPALIADFVAPLDAIVLPLLAVLDPVGSVCLAVGCPVRAASTEWETAGLMFAWTFPGFKRSDPNE